MNVMRAIAPAQGCFIGGEWAPAAGGGTIPVVCPSDGAVFAEIAAGGAADIDCAVRAARAAFLSFTGSPAVGASIRTAAARNRIGCTLELGGNSTQIVFADADLDAAVPVLAGAIVQNGGQTCSAGARALIHRSIWDETIARLAARFESLTAGAHHEDLDLGPLISARQRDRVAAHVARAGGADAPIVARGRVSPGAPSGGFYVAPTLVGPVAPDNPLAQEEVFGPFLVAIPFHDEAVAIANGADCGLVAGVRTRDGARQMRVAKAALRAGVPERLRRRRRDRAALRRPAQVGPRPREGVRGAVRVQPDRDHCPEPRVKT